MGMPISLVCSDCMIAPYGKLRFLFVQNMPNLDTTILVDLPLSCWVQPLFSQTLQAILWFLLSWSPFASVLLPCSGVCLSPYRKIRISLFVKVSHPFVSKVHERLSCASLFDWLVRTSCGSFTWKFPSFGNSKQEVFDRMQPSIRIFWLGQAYIQCCGYGVVWNESPPKFSDFCL